LGTFGKRAGEKVLFTVQKSAKNMHIKQRLGGVDDTENHREKKEEWNLAVPPPKFTWKRYPQRERKKTLTSLMKKEGERQEKSRNG